jgi:hypothetical protein
MMKIVYLILTFIVSSTLFASESNPLDFPGCPENSYCSKGTGEHRSEWLNILTKFTDKKISEKEANLLIQQKSGIPIQVWGTEEARKKPLTVLWDSPCKQHKIPTSKAYIGIAFLKKLMPKNSVLFHPPAVLLDEKKVPHVIPVLRGDSPLFIVNDSLYYTQDDEGHYYGLLISPSGNLSITQTFSDSHYPREVACTKQQIDLFTREIPSPNFFQGYYCKEIFNTKTKYYQTILTGWSCN